MKIINSNIWSYVILCLFVLLYNAKGYASSPDFNPVTPPDPGTNSWNPKTGVLIVDYFKEGDLKTTVLKIVGENNMSKVKDITIVGKTQSNDVIFSNYLSSVESIDLSRSFGYSYIPERAFFEMITLKEITLPSCIETIGANAFEGCRGLEKVSILSTLPPLTYEGMFKDIQGDLIINVPFESIGIYESKSTWQDFNIQKIVDSISTITINIPEDANTGKYNNLILELVNVGSGQKQKLIIGVSSQYSFSNIARKSVCAIYVKNSKGDVLAKVEDIVANKDEVDVKISSFLNICDVSVKVFSPAGEDVSGNTSVTWYDAKGKEIGRNSTLKSIVEGTELSYDIDLTQELGVQFVIPERQTFVVSKDMKEHVCNLQEFEKTTLRGRVVDQNSNTSIPSVSVSVIQLLNNKYSSITNCQTDRNGNFELTIINADASLHVTSSDYYAKELTYSANDTSQSLEIRLQPIEGIKIGLTYSFTESTFDESEKNTLQRYDDYKNISYSIYNVTKNEPIHEFVVEDRSIIVTENVEDGDILNITASSINNSFTPVTKEITINSTEIVEVTFDIIQLGGIVADIESSGNFNVVGTLYDSNGKYYASYRFTDNRTSISNLPAGNYTMIAMSELDRYNKVSTLSEFRSLGLKEQTDYAINTFAIHDGIIDMVHIGTVPEFNEDTHSFISEASTIIVNKTNVSVGNYVTVRADIKYKSEYNGLIKNPTYISLIPEGCSFVENSVMVDGKIVKYTLTNDKLAIPVTSKDCVVRYCLTAISSGECLSSASIQANVENHSKTESLGSTKFSVDEMFIQVPTTISSPTFYVGGTTLPNCLVDIFDGEELIGQTTSLSDGSWNAQCQLVNPYNLSSHKIKARIHLPNNEYAYTASSTIDYNISSITARSVTMINYAHGTGECQIKFDLTNNTAEVISSSGISGQSYRYDSSYPEFTFVAELSQEDSTNIHEVIIRVYTNGGNWYNLPAEYNSKIKKWVAVNNFDAGNLPVGVKVDFDAEISSIIDEQNISQLKDQIFLTIQDGNNIINKIDHINEEKCTPKQYEEKLMSIVDEVYGTSDAITYQEISTWSDKELEERLQELEEPDFTIEDLQDEISQIRELFCDEKDSWDTGDGIKVKAYSCLGLTADHLLESGFEEYTTTTGKIYVLRSEQKNVFVDFSQDFYIEISKEPKAYAKSSTLENGLDKFNIIIDNINSYYQPIAKAYEDTEKILGKLYLKFEKMLSSADAELPKAKTRYNMKMVKLERLEKELANMPTNDGKFYLKQLQVDTYRQEVKAAKSILDKLNAKKAFASMAVKLTKPIPKLFTKNIPLKKYHDIIYNGVQVVRNFQQLYLSVPDPCENDQDDANRCKSLCVAAAVYCEGVVLTKAGASALLDFATIDQLAATAATGGVSALTAIGTVILNMGGNLALDYVANKEFEKRANEITRIINELKCEDDKCPKCHKKPCECEKPCPKCGKKPCECKPCPYCHQIDCVCKKCPKCHQPQKGCTCPPRPRKDPLIDPSGYVYEGVSSNRIEGATVSCYFKEIKEDMYGDPHENVVFWNAEDYGQKNPLITDVNGMYAWDVPQGLWQVKYEKEGYETTYSDWLPVPPPQLEVNIPMVQLRHPEVKSVHAYKDGVEIEFDKYMLPETLTPDKIYVTANGENVEGEVIMLNEEVSYGEEGKIYASKVRFKPRNAFKVPVISLTIANKVKSYAGIQMQETFYQTFNIEQEIAEIKVASEIQIPYEGEVNLTISVNPSDAVVGKALIVKSASDMIASLEESRIILDEQGKAVVSVYGELPGTTALTFTIDGYEISATSVVNVISESSAIPEVPTANIVSGTTVTKGTTITLTCATEGAIIYYTLDGSCPCNEAMRLTYTQPIAINEDVTIKAIAISTDMKESEIAEFTYFTYATVNAPTASLNSGSAVYRGTTIALTADSKDLKVWYTMDGTYPSEENGSCKQYTEPIVINDNITIKAIAVNTDGIASEVSTFTYSILQSTSGIELNNGWTWVSFNMKNDALSNVNTTLASGVWTSEDEIKNGHYTDSYSAKQKKWIGTLSNHGKLNNINMFKIHSSKKQTLPLTGEAVRPSENNITVAPNWNYIAYTPIVTMSVAEAMSNYDAKEGDVLKSQNAFATYSIARGWEGDLTIMEAGKGYMLKRSPNASQTTFTYPESNTGTNSYAAQNKAYIHKYAENMNIAGVVSGIDIQEGDSIVAYVHGEYRGGNIVMHDGRVYLTLMGNEAANAMLMLLRDGEILSTSSLIIEYENNKVMGTAIMPTAITFVEEDKNAGIGEIRTIYSLNGINCGTRNISTLPSGVYLIYSIMNNKTKVSKFIKR